MAEFQEVMKQAKRMCKQYTNACDGCALYGEHNCLFQIYTTQEDKKLNFLADAEKIVMDWAANNPEPRYPSWNEVWRQLFPNASNAPCPLYCVHAHMVKEYCSVPRKCAICRSQPIPADIADKLGIKPIGGDAK